MAVRLFSDLPFENSASGFGQRTKFCKVNVVWCRCATEREAIANGLGKQAGGVKLWLLFLWGAINREFPAPARHELKGCHMGPVHAACCFQLGGGRLQRIRVLSASPNDLGAYPCNWQLVLGVSPRVFDLLRKRPAAAS